MSPSAHSNRIHFILFVSLFLSIVVMLSNASAKKIDKNISQKLTELDNLLQSGKAYLAYEGYINLLKQSPEQNIINQIAKSTGELYYTLRLTDDDYHISSHIFSKDNKEIYYIKTSTNRNDKVSLICKMDLDNFNETILAKKKFLSNGLIILSDDNHISLIFYDYWPHRWYIIPSLSSNNKIPYSVDQFDKMSQPYNILNSIDKETWNIYKDNPNIVIYVSKRQSELRINENGNDSSLLAPNQSVLQTAMLQSRGNGYFYSPSFSPDGLKLTFLINVEKLSGVSCYGKLMMSDFDGRNVRLLLNQKNIATPSFSPDGSKLVFSLIKKHEHTVWWYLQRMSVIGMIDADGKNFKEITYGILDDNSPILSNDNSKVAYVSTIGGYNARHLNLLFLNRYLTDKELLERLNNIETKQRAIFDVLKDIRKAQELYKNKNRKYAANIAALINEGLLTEDIKETYWDFNIKLESGLFTYKITATPVSKEKAGYVTFSFKDSDKMLDVILGEKTYSISWNNSSIRLLPKRLEHY